MRAIRRFGRVVVLCGSLAIAAFGGGGGGGSDGGGSAVDQFEPNEGSSSATRLDGGFGTESVEATLWPAGDEDWFVIDVPAGATLVARLSGGRPEYNVSLSGPGVVDPTSVFTAPADGRYFVRVDGWVDSLPPYEVGSTTPYRLDVRLENRPDLVEDGATWHDFTSVVRQGDTFTAGVRVRNAGSADATGFEVEFYASVNRYLLTDHDLSIGKTTIDGLSSGDTIDVRLGPIPFPAEIADDLFFVFWVIRDVAGLAEQSMENNIGHSEERLTVGGALDPHEPNETIDEASNVTPSLELSKYAVSGIIQSTGDVDWYSVDAGSVTAVVLTEGSGQVVFLYDGSGELIDQSTAVNATTARIDVEPPVPPGPYRIEVKRFDLGSDPHPYALTICTLPDEPWQPCP